MADREHDIVVFGATGFTGALTAEYLVRNAPSHIRWALAGRNRSKLERVRARLQDVSSAVAELPLLEADVTDVASVRSLAESTRLVISTVGPYILYANALVAACAAAGTGHFALTGDPQIVHAIWLRPHKQAEQTGA